MSEIDDLMTLDPLSLTRDAPEIAKLVAHYRAARAAKAAGIKPKKERGPVAPIESILDTIKQAPTVKATRR